VQDLASRPALVKRCYDFAATNVNKDSVYLAKDLKQTLDLYTSNDHFAQAKRTAEGHKPWVVADAAAVGGEAVPDFVKTAIYFNAQDVAKQLTFVDSEIFKSIRVCLPAIARN